jgi:hypothetical protein
MQVSYSNGTSITGPYDEKKFAEAIQDPNVVKACIYRPGEIVTMSDRKYKVGPNGNLIRQKD